MSALENGVGGGVDGFEAAALAFHSHCRSLSSSPCLLCCPEFMNGIFCQVSRHHIENIVCLQLTKCNSHLFSPQLDEQWMDRKEIQQHCLLMVEWLFWDWLVAVSLYSPDGQCQ